MPVPQIMEEVVEVTKVVPQDSSSDIICERIVEIPDPQVVDITGVTQGEVSMARQVRKTHDVIADPSVRVIKELVGEMRRRERE